MTDAMSVDNLDHPVKPPVADPAQLQTILHENVSQLHANGHRGEVVMLLATEPVYHAETGEQVHGFVHSHHARVTIHDNGYDVLPLE